MPCKIYLLKRQENHPNAESNKWQFPVTQWETFLSVQIRFIFAKWLPFRIGNRSEWRMQSSTFCLIFIGLDTFADRYILPRTRNGIHFIIRILIRWYIILDSFLELRNPLYTAPKAMQTYYLYLADMILNCIRWILLVRVFFSSEQT